ncbi:tRNA pseudouridine38-40 synthase [Lishizhenia tianjinensis]|uniref:tRNA pseudouridine synthase A n=1 Tax=Lishizhenia tianjinensis TaxID=477690 RepID=A0A1I6YWI0_9FLAO|nr:tRNA pseudouridine(38-40) synthase TruA [Lishizhenia tianjinensis]SFT54777.1 tRNA pseudouridine38-40 synthase [Lishizhenia tianjinensis]
MMQRFFFEISYNGTPYFGWQVQPKQVSVQETLENALTKLNSKQHVKVVGCGRTDTGVHAHHYIFHADLPQHFKDVEQLKYKLNKMLPPSIAIHNIFPVKDEAHARFGATNRTYRYFIRQEKNPFEVQTSTYFPKELDLEAMNKGAQYLLGRKDFTSLSKLHTDVKTNICDVRKAHWFRQENGMLVFEISADRFLRNMVRATVGTLLDVGLGKIKASDIPAILEAKDRGEAKISAPADGLYLWKIEYDWEQIKL